MGTTLTGTTPQDTYDSLIKVTNNGPLSSTARYLSDGLGNDSVLALSTSRVGIGTTSPDTALDVNGGSKFRGSISGFGGAEILLNAGNNSQVALSTNGTGTTEMYFDQRGTATGIWRFRDTTDTRMSLTSVGLGIGTSSPSTTLDVLGTSFLRGNVNAGKTSNINVTTAENGTGGGNREFVTFTGASATGFTGTDSSDQGYGYFPVAIVSGRSYEVSATMVVTNGSPLTFITSTGKNFATDTVQTVQSVPVSGTTYRFVASGNASYFGVAASNSGGSMTCVVSNFSLKEVGSVLVTSDSNVGIGTSSPAGKLTVSQANLGGVAAILLTQDESTIQGPSANTYLKMGGNMTFGAAGVIPIQIATTEVLRVTSNGLTFNGDTAAANALDDYEEGTFTPAIAGSGTAGTATYAAQLGRYTKIGRQVSCQIDLSWSGGTGSGSMRIINLPFNESQVATNPAVTIGFIDSISLTASHYALAYIANGSNRIDLIQAPVGGGSVIDIPYDAAGRIIVNVTYLAS